MHIMIDVDHALRLWRTSIVNNCYAWDSCWFVVYIRRFIYKFLNVCPFDYTAVAGSRKVGPVNQVHHTSLVAVVTPTDRPTSVCNRCVIELFVALFVLSLCPFDISVGVGAFVIGLSQISSFCSFHILGIYHASR